MPGSDQVGFLYDGLWGAVQNMFGSDSHLNAESGVFNSQASLAHVVLTLKGWNVEWNVTHPEEIFGFVLWPSDAVTSYASVFETFITTKVMYFNSAFYIHLGISLFWYQNSWGENI